MPDVVIYTKPFCPYCADAKALLKKKGVDFTEVNVASDRSAFQTMVQRAGGRTTVPQVFIGDKHIGGCDDTYDLDARGGLDPLLKG